MDDDPYGFASDLESEAAKVLDKAGLAEFVRQVEDRFKAAATAKPTPGEPFGRNPENQRRVWGVALHALPRSEEPRSLRSAQRGNGADGS